LRFATETSLARADECLQRAGSALDVAPRGLDDITRLHLFLEAQSCVGEAQRRQAERTAERDRKRNEEIADRDHKLEVWVLRLIGLEIVLSVVGIIAGYQQGTVLDKQTTALTHMDSSTATTASAMQTAASLLQTLSSDQAVSLQILQKQEAERSAQLAKKPKIVLYIGGVPAKKSAAPAPYRERTDTSSTDDLLLKNEGNAPATNVLIRIVVSAKDVDLKTNPPHGQPVEPPDISYHTITIPVGLLRPNTSFPMNLTFTYPKNHAPFTVVVNVDANEVDTATQLGQININPQNPQ